MDDLSEKLNRLLSSPDSLKQIGDMLSMFGGEPSPMEPVSQAEPGPQAEPGGSVESPSPMDAAEVFASLFGGAGGSAANAPGAPSPEREASPASDPLSGLGALFGGGGGMPDLSMLMKLAPLLGQMGKEDENTALLHALRPYLRNGREKRLDESVQMLRMMKLLPLLQGMSQLKNNEKGGEKI